MKNKSYTHMNTFTRDMCQSCQRKEIKPTKTKYEKLVEKFNKRYGNSK